MISKWTNFKAWVKMIFTLVCCIVVLLIILMNRNHRTDVWVFYSFREVSVLWLILVTAAATLVVYWVARGIFGEYRRIKQYRRERPGQPGRESGKVD